MSVFTSAVVPTYMNWQEMLLRFVLTFLLCGLMGLERERKGRPAGLRTFLLVGCGSVLFTMASIHFGSIYQADSARVAAQIVPGVGFLGAGTILTTDRRKVLGLTTAAGLWACAAIGLAIGCGLYLPAVVGGLLFFFALFGLDVFERYFHKRVRSLSVEVEYTDAFSMQSLLIFTREQGCTIRQIEHDVIRTPAEEIGSLHVTLEFNRSVEPDRILGEIRKLDGVLFAHRDE